MTGKRGEDRGTIAIMSALMATVLFGCAALAIDLGNAMNRKAQTQTDTDMAALAGGTELPDTKGTPGTPDAGDDAVLAVADYLIKNDVYDDDAGFKAKSLTKATLAAKLVSGTTADRAAYGWVRYGYYKTTNGTKTFVNDANYLTLLGPSRRITFGLAKAVGFDGTNVSAAATVGIKSKGSVSAIPFYAYSGCDWGHQVINHSTANSTGNSFYTNGDWDTTTEAAQPTIDPPTSGYQNANPQHLDYNQPQTLTITGTNFRAKVGTDERQDYVMSVGFFKPDGTAPVLEIPASQFVSMSSTEIKVPGTIASSGQDGQTYYIRTKWHTYDLKKSGSLNKEYKYGSAVAGALAYVDVGDTTLFCNDQKSSGNFGSLHVVRFDGSSDNSNSGWLPLNIALGLDSPIVKLNTYSPPNTIDSNSCSNSDSKAYQSDSNTKANADKINCVVTDTGFAGNPATAGFITGVGSNPGRLTKVDSGCGGLTTGKPKTRSVTINGKGTYTLNDERLTCYLTTASGDTSVSLADISSSSYNGATVLSKDIFTSPRFVFVPIINLQPQNGKKSYPIVNYRAAFITGENGAAYKGHPETDTYYVNTDGTVGGAGGAADNGISVDNNGLNSFQVVFINSAALPPIPADGKLVDYTGTGPKQLVMVN